MEQGQQAFVLQVLDTAQDLTLATIRPDVGIGRHSQKAENIRANGKVSLTINLPYQDWRAIRGLSMSAFAEVLDVAQEISQAAACLERRFPAVQEWCGPDMAQEVAFVRIRPQMVSVIDYSKGFGHTELVKA
jgi:hypothetical protein